LQDKYFAEQDNFLLKTIIWLYNR